MSKPSEAVLSKLSKNILDCLDVRESESEFECYQTKYLNNAEREAIERLGGVCEPSGKFFLWRVPKKKAVGSQRIVIGKVDQKRLPITLIDASPFQFRSKIDNEKILELCRSIKQVGVLEPIGVRTKEEGRFEVVFGHRRYEACKRLKLTEIPVHELVLGDEEVIFAQLIENLQREDASDYDVGKAFSTLNKKLTLKELHEKVGLSERHIQRYIEHYRFCDILRPKGRNVKSTDVSQLTERITRPLRKIEDKERIKEVTKEIIDVEKPKITKNEIKQIYKQVVKPEIVSHQNEEVDKFLTEHSHLISWLSYRERGSFGDNNFKGNASGYLLVELINHFKPKYVFDPMEGSGTSREVCKAMGILYEGSDILKGTDLVECDVSKIPINDLTYFHPPYWDIIKYSDHPNDLSNTKTWQEFETKLTQCINKLLPKTKLLSILIADIFMGSDKKFHSPLPQILYNHKDRLTRILVKVQEHFSRGARPVYKLNPDLIPVRHEYIILLKGDLN